MELSLPQPVSLSTTEEEPVNIIWTPTPGSQTLAITSPVWETLYEGTRGPGKTIWLLMAFAQHVGKGMGSAWRGIIFRETYKQLEDLIAKSKEWFPQIFPGAHYGEQSHTWTWPSGEQLLLRYMKREADYWNYHGHEYPFIGWDELTNWAEPGPYLKMMACNRSTNHLAAQLKQIRATANPWGKGHNWVKMRFIDPMPRGHIYADPDTGKERVAIHGHYTENLPLMAADPDYKNTILMATSGGLWQVKAWLEGDWDIVAGGMFDDLWRDDIHFIQPWRPEDTPVSWRIYRAYDHGSSKPFSVGWWAKSDGTKAPNGRVYPPKTLVRIGEWYGWDKRTPNVGVRMQDVDIAKGIVSRETDMGIRDRVRAGPADNTIFFAEPGHRPIYKAFKKAGVKFVEADKKPGSRIPGWEHVRLLMKAAKEGDHDNPWLLIFNTCVQFRRTIPVLPRDESNPDDADTDAEDHIADETRYMIATPIKVARTVEHQV